MINGFCEFGVIYTFGLGDSLGWRMGDNGMELSAGNARQDNIYFVVNTAYVF